MVLVDLQPRQLGWGSPYIGSLAELNDTPKPAVRGAAIEGIADLAIRGFRNADGESFHQKYRIMVNYAYFS